MFCSIFGVVYPKTEHFQNLNFSRGYSQDQYQSCLSGSAGKTQHNLGAGKNRDRALRWNLPQSLPALSIRRWMNKPKFSASSWEGIELHYTFRAPSFLGAAPKTSFCLACLKMLRESGILSLINYLRNTIKTQCYLTPVITAIILKRQVSVERMQRNRNPYLWECKMVVLLWNSLQRLLRKIILLYDSVISLLFI